MYDKWPSPSSPLADHASDDGQCIHDAQCDVGDSVDSWSQDKYAEHHQTGDDDIDGDAQEERLVDGEPADFA